MDLSIFGIMDLIGIFAFSVSGAVAATRKRMDVYGVFLLAIVTALGGGTIRDILIGNTPVFVLLNPFWLVIPAVVTAASFIVPLTVRRGLRTLLIMDAIGIGIFSVSGVSAGLELGIPLHGSVLLGVITSTAGGITRDLLAGEVPLVLRRDIYASASVIGGILYWLLLIEIQLGATTSALVCTSIVILIRVLSYTYGWHLPYPHRSRLPRRSRREGPLED